MLYMLGDVKMFHVNARKLIQEMRVIQTESSLLGTPFADNTLFFAFQKCMIHHPVYKGTVATVHQLSFDALTTTLSTCQTTGSNNQDESTKEAKTDNNGTDAKVANKPQKI
ncbi:uncharacterized protein UDID_18892 [Ustilago sp. UG-2017a]|nr:uncharacterized protein UDID_18892 [Ustilago sp. UG-2017a]